MRRMRLDIAGGVGCDLARCVQRRVILRKSFAKRRMAVVAALTASTNAPMSSVMLKAGPVIAPPP